MRSTASAPAALDSYIWKSSKMKSFLRIGILRWLFMGVRKSSLPLKYFSSVTTDTAAAPPTSYERAMS